MPPWICTARSTTRSSASLQNSFVVRVAHRGRAVDERLHRVDVDGAVREHCRHHLVLADRLAERHARPGVVHRQAMRLLGRAQAVGPERQPAAVQRRHGDLEALPPRAEARLVADDAAVEVQGHGGAAALAHLLFALAHDEALGRARHEEGGHAARALARIRHGEHGHEVRGVSRGDPDLLAVDAPTIFDARGARLHRGRVGTRIGLRQRVAAQHFAGRHLRQPSALLLFAAADQHAHRADGGVRAVGHRAGEARLGQFLHHDAQAGLAQAGAAELGRNGDRGQAAFGHARQQLARHAVLALDLGGQRAHDLVGEVAGGRAQEGQFLGSCGGRHGSASYFGALGSRDKWGPSVGVSSTRNPSIGRPCARLAATPNVARQVLRGRQAPRNRRSCRNPGGWTWFQSIALSAPWHGRMAWSIMRGLPALQQTP
jgi:hypothetical protein